MKEFELAATMLPTSVIDIGILVGLSMAASGSPSDELTYAFIPFEKVLMLVIGVAIDMTGELRVEIQPAPPSVDAL